MASLLIKHIPDDVLRNLKARAAAHGRSVQDEVVAIITALSTTGAVNAAALADKVRKLLAQPAPEEKVSAKAVSPGAATREPAGVSPPTGGARAPTGSVPHPVPHDDEVETVQGRRGPQAGTQPTMVIRQRKDVPR